VLAVGREAHADDLAGLGVEDGERLLLAERVQVVDGDEGLVGHALGDGDVALVGGDAHGGEAGGLVRVGDELLGLLVDVVDDYVGAGRVDYGLLVLVADAVGDVGAQADHLLDLGDADRHFDQICMLYAIKVKIWCCFLFCFVNMCVCIGWSRERKAHRGNLCGVARRCGETPWRREARWLLSCMKNDCVVNFIYFEINYLASFD